VFDDVKERRLKCDRGPLDFLNRFLPVAENESEVDDEYDSKNEAGAEEATKKRKLNPNFAEADHCHVPVARYASHLVSVLNRGWLPALLWKGKVFKAIVHFMFSFTKPEDVTASCVRGLSDTFLTNQWASPVEAPQMPQGGQLPSRYGVPGPSEPGRVYKGASHALARDATTVEEAEKPKNVHEPPSTC
jgi:hypothetical protein